MSFFDFVANAGHFNLEDKASDADKAEVIKKEMGHVSAADHVDVQIENGKVILSGKASSAEEMEKWILAAGNGKGVEQVESHIEIEDDAPASTFYTVERGDNLSKIAKAHYGKSSKYMTIFNANKPMLSDPDKIYPGQVLRIPPLD